MAGNTGKLTNEELERRGPRNVLLEIIGENNQKLLLLAKENALPLYTSTCWYRVVAKSFSLHYLLKIAKFR